MIVYTLAIHSYSINVIIVFLRSLQLAFCPHITNISAIPRPRFEQGFSSYIESLVSFLEEKAAAASEKQGLSAAEMSFI